MGTVAYLRPDLSFSVSSPIPSCSRIFLTLQDSVHACSPCLCMGQTIGPVTWTNLSERIEGVWMEGEEELV